MKKRDKNHHKREPVLDKEVITPNGKYRLSLTPSIESPFQNSFTLKIKHLSPGFLEEMLNQDEKIWADACHDFEQVYPGYGRTLFQNTTPREVGYHSQVGQFYIDYYQDSVFPDKGNSIPQMPRTRHFPIPSTISRQIRQLLQNK